MFNFKNYLKEKQQIINFELTFLIENFAGSNRIDDAMEYSLMAGGKRLRPILALAASEAVAESVTGKDFKNVLRIGCAIEMIHTYSLIHDDLPAIDNDDIRRGKPTSHTKFNEATAILSGDALLTLGFQTLFPPTTKPNNYEKWFEAVGLIADAAGYSKMIEGQMRDIESEGKNLSLQELKDIHLLKTGALINASVCAGAIIGGANSVQIEHLTTYAKNIGLAFQVIDDILNVKGDPKLMGKAVGSDKSLNKNTFASILGIEDSEIYAKKLINKAVNAIDNDHFYNDCKPLKALALYIIERDR
jgi:geranylgeranyl diphosphate synthase, type II